MGYDFKQSHGRKHVLQTLKGEAFQRTFPYGATISEIAFLLQLSSSHIAESLGYLASAGLVLRGKNGRHMAADSTTADQPVTRRFLTPEEWERLYAGVPSAGVLTAEQQFRLDTYRAKVAAL